MNNGQLERTDSENRPFSGPPYFADTKGLREVVKERLLKELKFGAPRAYVSELRKIATSGPPRLKNT